MLPKVAVEVPGLGRDLANGPVGRSFRQSVLEFVIRDLPRDEEVPEELGDLPACFAVDHALGRSNTQISGEAPS
jgi:hypothetical protein